MRVIKNISNADFKITLYGWNQKFIIKIEDDLYEQTYKVSEFDLSSENEVDEILNDEFLESVKENFKNMHAAFGKAIDGINGI